MLVLGDESAMIFGGTYHKKPVLNNKLPRMHHSRSSPSVKAGVVSPTGLYNATTLASGDELPMNLAAMQDFLMSFCQAWEANFRESLFQALR
jgi:hypothetical protein